MIRTLPLVLAAALGAAPPGDDAPIDFDRDVRPILAKRCITCHGGVTRKAGLSFRFRDAVLAPARSGRRAVVPGDPGESELLRRITAGDDDRMPPKGDRLTAAEIGTLRRWIAEGAPWKPHWAFTPLAAPDVPSVNRPEWTRNGIDRFVLARLEQEGLAPSPEADRATLIRRAAFTLTGLPPTPDEVARFLSDSAPGAHERMVDRYLSSPAYGERWGKLWLDAAGYADSNGYFHADTDRPHAWRYRDWVIDAVNDDLPFDTFVRWQLAGDEIAGYVPGGDVTPDMVPKLVATHFFRNAPDGTGESDGNPEERQRDRLIVLEGNVRNLGSALLGLTVGCAKCHDHPFEPLTQAEYYGLQALVSGVYPDDPGRWIKPQDRLIVVGTRAQREAHEKTKKRIEGRIRELEKELGALTRETRERLLADLDEETRTRARKILETEEKKRPEQDRTWLEALTERDEAYARKRRTLEDRIAEARKRRPPDLPRIAAAWERQPDTIPHPVKKRGVYTSPGPEAKPGVPASLVGPGYTFQIRKPEGLRSSGRRLALARWITSPNHPLLARITVNRIWQNHFGHGLAGTPDNLGQSGARPSHPELLDWLAARFVKDGWSRKALHRLILASATWRQRSLSPNGPPAADPGNRLHWRGPFLRLDAESVRDGMMSVAGILDRNRGGPYVPTKRIDGTVVVEPGHPGARRRSVYLQHRRTQVLTMLRTFDAPPIVSNCTRRSVSNVPLQSLSLLNSDFSLDCAGGLAERVGTDAGDPVGRAFLLALARGPRDAERKAAEAFVAKQRRLHGDDEGRVLRDLCQMILASSAFLYTE